jgi:hypothetical protein
VGASKARRKESECEKERRKSSEMEVEGGWRRI